MALTDKLSAIGVAIRQKTGSTALMTLDEMPTAIASITTGGGGGGDCNGLHMPESALVFTGNSCSNLFENASHWKWIYDMYPDKVTTEFLTSTGYMFSGNNDVIDVPTDFNFDGVENGTDYMFSCATNIKTISGKFYNMAPYWLERMFERCFRLRYLPEFVDCNWDKLREYTSFGMGLFDNCRSLRSIPEELLKELWCDADYPWGVWTNYLFTDCYALDEVRGLRVPTTAYELVDGNMFDCTFDNCYHLKDVIFATQEDGTPYTSTMSNQVIDLSNYVGWANGNTGSQYITMYNSGITAKKRVDGKTSYNNLKNDPDWYSTMQYYSRYNHDSAVNTINSLPDTSEFLATRGGESNIIKFLGSAGESTDGKAISTLTTTEIAVATAKGWTVSLS